MASSDSLPTYTKSAASRSPSSSGTSSPTHRPLIPSSLYSSAKSARHRIAMPNGVVRRLGAALGLGVICIIVFSYILPVSDILSSELVTVIFWSKTTIQRDASRCCGGFDSGQNPGPSIRPIPDLGIFQVQIHPNTDCNGFYSLYRQSPLSRPYSSLYPSKSSQYSPDGSPNSVSPTYQPPGYTPFAGENLEKYPQYPSFHSVPPTHMYPLPLAATLDERIEAWRNAPGRNWEPADFVAWNLQTCGDVIPNHNKYVALFLTAFGGMSPVEFADPTSLPLLLSPSWLAFPAFVVFCVRNDPTETLSPKPR